MTIDDHKFPSLRFTLCSPAGYKNSRPPDDPQKYSQLTTAHITYPSTIIQSPSGSKKLEGYTHVDSGQLLAVRAYRLRHVKPCLSLTEVSARPRGPDSTLTNSSEALAL